VIYFSVVAEVAFPLVASGIGQFQAALHLLQSHAVSAVVLSGLGVVGVLNVAGDAVLVGLDADVDI
jgi:hypothetical protein